MLSQAHGFTDFRPSQEHDQQTTWDDPEEEPGDDGKEADRIEVRILPAAEAPQHRRHGLLHAVPHHVAQQRVDHGIEEADPASRLHRKTPPSSESQELNAGDEHEEEIEDPVDGPQTAVAIEIHNFLHRLRQVRRQQRAVESEGVVEAEAQQAHEIDQHHDRGRDDGAPTDDEDGSWLCGLRIHTRSESRCGTTYGVTSLWLLEWAFKDGNDR